MTDLLIHRADHLWTGLRGDAMRARTGLPADQSAVIFAFLTTRAQRSISPFR